MEVFFFFEELVALREMRDGGSGVRFEDLKEVEVLWTCSLSDLGEMEEP